MSSSSSLHSFFPVVLRGRLRLVLNESEDVAVGIDDGGDDAATADFVGRVLDRRTSGSDLGDLRFDVVDVPVRDRRRQSLRTTAREQSDVLARDVVADVVLRVRLRVDAEESGV